MRVLVTGAAGFIGSHVAHAILDRGDEVIGVDNVNDYYDVRLKEARLDHLAGRRGFFLHRLNVADRDGMLALAATKAEAIVHLAAQAGVRHSLMDPYVYAESNVMGQVVMLELARRLSGLKHFVYASSSSVYGGNAKTPFSVDDPVDRPMSFYAATKRSDELITWTYSHLYGLPCTGLRFFTVYGPWGRPDMAAFVFTCKILAGEPIAVFNHGNMKRDFTYIDDVVAGVVAALDHAPDASPGLSEPPARLYNLGNSRSERLLDYIGLIEQTLGRKAVYDFQPLQPGDVPETCADITSSIRDFGYAPRTTIAEGIPKFVAWYREYFR
ncbi:MAG: NAD-dependent epimerase/dehydratase family protein [Bdellovibrionales bacterium]